MLQDFSFHFTDSIAVLTRRRDMKVTLEQVNIEAVSKFILMQRHPRFASHQLKLSALTHR